MEWDKLIERISTDYPDLSLTEGANYSWHASKKRILFRKAPNTQNDMWALLHEVGHALLDHSSYTYDIELLQLEAIAWRKAEEVAQKYTLHIDTDYAQDCLDTYRDWLHTRATCPTCLTRSLQVSPRQYQCFNCKTEWQVSRSRLCRPYRLRTI